MKTAPKRVWRHVVFIGLFTAFSLFAQVTNVSTNSNDIEDAKFKKFDVEMRQMLADANRNLDKFEDKARTMIKEFPTRTEGYQFLMDEMQMVKLDRARVLAKEMADEVAAPEQFRLWAKGFLKRLDSFGKPLFIHFTSLDGRDVDTSTMKGKVVLIDFWGTSCVPCVEEITEIKAAYDKFHDQGFEVIGISQDTDKTRLEKFIKDNNIPWPQCFDGKQQGDNKLSQELGIAGIPHTLLLDKNGCLRADDIGMTGILQSREVFEKGITKLLSE